MDPRDAALQALTPTVMVPQYGQFEPLQISGHRFLQGGNGFFLEVRRPWLYARVRLQDKCEVAMPYGEVTEQIDLLCGPVPLQQIQVFASMARESSPNEAAVWVVWNSRSGAFSIKHVDVRTKSAGHIEFGRPRLDDGEHLVLDMHSHGTGKAFFSRTDNRDDGGEVKIAMVLGDCDKETFSSAIRLCLLGKFIALKVASAVDGAVTFKESEMQKQSPGGQI